MIKGSKAIRKLITAFPSITVEKITQNGHMKVFLDTPAGKQILTCSVSASDSRAVQNNRSILKRWAQGESK